MAHHHEDRKDKDYENEVSIMGERLLESLDFLEKKVKGLPVKECKEGPVLLRSENEALKKEINRLKREVSYKDTLQKHQEQHQAIFELESKYFALRKEAQELEAKNLTLSNEHEREKRKLEDTIDDLQHKVTEISSRASKAEASVRKLTADYNDLKMSRDCSERAAKESISSTQKEMENIKQQMQELKLAHIEEIRSLDQNGQKERLQYEEKLLHVGENARKSWAQQKQQYERTIDELQEELKKKDEAPQKGKTTKRKTPQRDSTPKRTEAPRRSKRAPPSRKRLRTAAPNESTNEITFD